MPHAVWDDVTVLLPWNLYLSYGDKDILLRQYPSMIAWVDQGIRRGEDGLWHPDQWQLGDWLDPAAPLEEPGDSRTNGVLVADAYLVHVTSVMGEVSSLLDKTDDSRRFRQQAADLKHSFPQKYVAPSGLLVGDTQTALALAIRFGLHENATQAAEAGARLAKLVRQAQFRVSTGFAGTPIITHALTKSGHFQVAYRMLLETSRPSWMYPITMGATTIWERWDSMLPDGTVNPGEMTSFNHYALGSIINWLHERVAGLRLLEPGWKTFEVSPIPGGGLTWAKASYMTPYGQAECGWKIERGDQFQLDVLVPPNSRALILLPDSDSNSKEGQWVGSGRHTFTSRWSSITSWPPKPIYPPIRDEPKDTIAEG